MTFLHNKLGHLWKDESGQSLIEYSLISSLVAIGAIAAMYYLRVQIIAVFQTITNSLNAAI